jgi:chitodextrinase
VKVCAESGGQTTEFCPKPISALVIAEHPPAECDLHTEPIEIEVPKLLGLAKDEALARLDKLKLTAKVIEKPVPGVAAGIVAEQTPAAGTKVEAGTVVTLTVSSGTASNQAPKPAFTAPSEAKSGKAAEFDGSGSTDDGSIVTYYWEFGDGSTGTGKTATHTYELPGTYEVTLWVTDDAGQQASVTKSVVVK